jgi:hypothetical protein
LWVGWGLLKSCYHESGQSASGARERNIPGFPGTEFGYFQQNSPADLLEYYQGEIQTNGGRDHETISRRYFQSIELTYNIPGSLDYQEKVLSTTLVRDHQFKVIWVELYVAVRHNSTVNDNKNFIV